MLRGRFNLLKLGIPMALTVLAMALFPAVSLAAGEMLSEKDVLKEFISLNSYSVGFLFVLGFLGGLISGFIGSGGAFVLTPGMMSLGAPAAVAVATNMCHKFPKALVGAYKRFKYGQVDMKLGLIMAVSATVGVQIGIRIQKLIFAKWGAAGSNLYVSLVFVGILTGLGIYIMTDAIRSMQGKKQEGVSRLVERIRKIQLPPMIYFKSTNTKTSLWVTVPVGLGTGLLAATIAVGGFIGVPGMIYIMGVPAIMASATELVIAFAMGLSGSLTWALGGFVDIRMVLILLCGSLLGVQLGAVGTTYVKEYMIKFVMATIMLIVAVSRGFAIPTYLNQLGTLQIASDKVILLTNISFIIMCIALATGGVIILGNMIMRKKEIDKETQTDSQRALNHG